MSRLFEVLEELPQEGKSNEWYTPSKYVEAAREVMGSIDLDPASCVEANQTVRASKFYSLQDDGLSKPWHGHVWLNPPFTAAVSGDMPQLTWAKKLLSEYEQGNIEQGILLIMALVKNKWFHDLWGMLENPICFSRKRIHFMRPGLRLQELRESVCYIYVGRDPQKFIEVFSEFGTMAQRISVSQAPIQQPALWDNIEPN